MLKVPLEGVEAKLSIASPTAMEQRTRAPKMRGLKKADCDCVFFLINGFLVVWPLDSGPGGARPTGATV